MAKRLYIFFSVMIAGGCVLVAEILATRLISPFYGSGLYLWSALIGVTLLALSSGYWLGGRVADRRTGMGIYCFLIIAAGLWISGISWLLHPVLALTGRMGLRSAVLLSALLLFFPPMAFLGMITPFAIRLRTGSLKVVGRRAGELYAVSTAASVIAALLAGFYLVPELGAARLALLCGALLVASGLAGGLLDKRSAIPSAIMIIAAVSAAWTVDPGPSADPGSGLLEVTDSPYAEIRVVDYRGLRLMLIDGTVHTEVDSETLENTAPYVDVLGLAGRMFSRPGKMLLIGLGGGSVVKEYASDGWKVDAVEIDPEVTRTAVKYFGLKPGEADIYNTDGREFLIESREKYQVIVVDAFGSSSIPFHLVTEESFRLLHDRLAPGGVVTMNVIAVGWRNELVNSIAATLASVFKNVEVLPIVEPPDKLGNLVIMASDRAIELTEELPVPDYRFSSEYNRAHAWDNRFVADSRGARVLTDDLNPVDVWAERVNLEMRKALHVYFGASGLGW